MPGQHPLESVLGEPRQRPLQFAPGIPARLAERLQVLALVTPGQGIPGEQIRLLEQENHAAPRVPWDRDGKQALPNFCWLGTVQQVGRVWRGRTIILVDPHPRLEMPSVALGIGDIIAVRQQDIVYSTQVLKLLHQLVDVPRRVYEQIAFGSPDKVRVRSIRSGRVVTAAVNSRREFLRKKVRRRGAMALGADRRSRAHKHRTPSSEFLFFVRGLPREYGFSLVVDDEARCDLARSGTVDAVVIDVPVARS